MKSPQGIFNLKIIFILNPAVEFLETDLEILSDRQKQGLKIHTSFSRTGWDTLNKARNLILLAVQ